MDKTLNKILIYLHISWWAVFNHHRFNYLLKALSRGILLEFAYELAIKLENKYDE